MAAEQRTTCMYDGDTFTGTFTEAGRGGEAAVTVRFGGREATAATGRLTASGAAQRLLGGLVRDRLSAERRVEALAPAE